MTSLRPQTTCVNRTYNGVAEKQSQQHNPKVRSRQKPSHKSNVTLEKLTTISRKRSRGHSRVCLRNFATLVNYTNSVRIRLLIRGSNGNHSIDSCSPQPHETWVISHDCTETHSPTKPGLGSLFLQQLTQPEARIRPYGRKGY